MAGAIRYALAGAAAGLLLTSCVTVDTTEEEQPPQPTAIGEQPPGAPSPPETTPSPPVTATPQTVEPQPTNPPQGEERCEVRELQANLEGTSGAAGSTEITISLLNVSQRTCELHGFPGVSYVTAPDGDQVGNAATRTGEIPGSVNLPPSAYASFTVRAVDVENYPEEDCQPTSVSGLRIYPPNDTEYLYVGYQTTGCESTRDDIQQLEVTAVEPGLSQ